MFNNNPNSSRVGAIFKVAAAGAGLFLLYNIFNTAATPNPQEISYTALLDKMKGHEITSIKMNGRHITASGPEIRSVQTYLPENDNIVPDAIKNGVELTSSPPQQPGLLAQLLFSMAPILLLLGVWVYFMRQMQAKGGAGPMSFGKSKARLIGDGQNDVTFADVAGCDEAKEEVSEVVDFLRDPTKYGRLGGKVSRGILMTGDPGVGKTLLARAMAGEAKVPFFTISGSDFVEMFVGVGASRVRDMFEQARKHSPCILFIDEIDAVGRARGNGIGGGNDEREQTLNQLLVEMDGFEGDSGVIVIAATNRPDVLDPALKRPGRFDSEVHVPLPDLIGREQILQVHVRRVPIGQDVNLRAMAASTPGFSGADLANLVNKAAVLASRKNKKLVTMSDFESARDKIMMGAERRMKMSEEELDNTAWHEAGHAVMGMCTPECDPVHRVSIIPRGRTLGVTLSLPEQDRHSFSLKQLKGRIAMLYGGRVAEEMRAGGDPEAVTTGASNDIEVATDLARKMVARWGFSTLGPAFLETNPQAVQALHSDDTKQKVDQAFLDHLTKGEKRAREKLAEEIDLLKRVVANLRRYETLDDVDLKDIRAGIDIAERKEAQRQEALAEKSGSSAQANDNDPDKDDSDQIPPYRSGGPNPF